MLTFLYILFISLASFWFYIKLRQDVYEDFAKWQNKIPVKHIKEAVQRVIRLSPSFLLMVTSKKIIGHNIWWALLTSAMLIFSVWWEFFDGWYNKKRGYPWRFNGTHDPDDAKLDRFLYMLGDWQGVLKWGLILISLIGFLFLKS